MSEICAVNQSLRKIDKKYGEMLKQARTEQNLSLSQTAKEFDCSKRQLIRIENFQAFPGERLQEKIYKLYQKSLFDTDE